jgi:hypothetical protein
VAGEALKTLRLIRELAGSLLERIPRKWFVFGAIAFVVFYRLYDSVFERYLPEQRTWYGVMFPALAMVIPASIFYVLPHYLRELQLLANADRPRLEDGRRVAVHGTLQSESAPLTSPFTRRPCLFYEYTIFHYVSRRSQTDDPTNSITDFTGFRKLPFVLRSSVGDLRLLDYVSPTVTYSVNAQDPSAAATAGALVKDRVFEESWERFLAAKESGDFRRAGATLDHAERIIEGCLPPGEEICILGKWSSSSMGLQSVGVALGAYTVVRGNPRDARGAIVQRVFKDVLIALLFAAFINAFAFLMLKG